ncbi:hypothetical protein J1N09_02830 [Aureitalea sp. L0-47]|nr:hypothetical protein [Aureitalea sp. L0-47]MCW5518757.1 hypothetical protein [Aureitalea sp. L0-47]
MKRDFYLTHRPLADMHSDGVRFNEQLLKMARNHPQHSEKHKNNQRGKTE